MKIAIVGSRRMSLYGKEVIGELVRYLIEKGQEILTIDTSGGNREIVRMVKMLNGIIMVVPTSEGFEKANVDLANCAEKLIVIEGKKGSGTLLVAKQFLDLGKEIWAVPGNIFEENSWTPNFLIKNGAEPILSIEEIL